MIKEEIRFVDSNILEGMTSISALFDAKKRGVNDRPVLEIRFDRAKVGKKTRELHFLREKCREWQIPLTLTDAAEIDRVCVGQTHGGIIAVCGVRTFPAPSEADLPENGFFAFLDGIEDPYNFGYALRSLYAAGCDGVLLGERNWMSAAGVVARASAGASESLPFFAGDPAGAVALFRSRGYRVICAGIRNAVSLYEADLKKPVLLVVGGEKRGISKAILSLADEIVRIDYGRPFCGSLSTASAATVLAFEILHQNALTDR